MSLLVAAGVGALPCRARNLYGLYGGGLQFAHLVHDSAWKQCTLPHVKEGCCRIGVSVNPWDLYEGGMRRAGPQVVSAIEALAASRGGSKTPAALAAEAAAGVALLRSLPGGSPLELWAKMARAVADAGKSVQPGGNR